MIAPLELPLPRFWGMGVPPGQVRTPCAMGCDVRPDSWDVAIGDVVRPEPDRPVARLLFYGKVRNEKDILFLIDQYPVFSGIIDCRPETTIVERLIRALRARNKDFWRAQYSPNTSGNVEVVVDDKHNILTLNRTMALNNVWFAANGGVGLALPQNFREICGGQFAAELCTPTCVSTISRGEEVRHWTPGKDHAMHAMAYLLMSIQQSRLSMAGSDTITTIPGSVVSTVSSSADSLDMDGDFVDPMTTYGLGVETEDGGMAWGDDAGV